MELDIVKNYKFIEKIGYGGYGEIYKGINVKTNIEVAIKLEDLFVKNPLLFYEAKVYKYLLSDTSAIGKGIANLYYCGFEEDYTMLVMDLLGPTLYDLFCDCDHKFSLKTILMLADQMLDRIEYIHSRYFLHRDIKPSNFVIGVGKSSHQIYIIDFGFAKKYIKKSGYHISYKKNKGFTGTSTFASINTHLGVEQSRRDDLEQLGYVLLYFLRGSLPWQGIKGIKEERYKKIMQTKKETKISKLCEGFPQEFVTYLKYCRKLDFNETPNYDYLRNLFKNLFKQSGFEFDYIYDWVSLSKDKKDEEKNATLEKPVDPAAQNVNNNIIEADISNVKKEGDNEEEKNDPNDVSKDKKNEEKNDILEKTVDPATQDVNSNIIEDNINNVKKEGDNEEKKKDSNDVSKEQKDAEKNALLKKPLESATQNVNSNIIEADISNVKKDEVNEEEKNDSNDLKDGCDTRTKT